MPLSNRHPGVGPRARRLRRLSVEGFRNLRDQTLEFPEEGVTLVGANAQGKTNLLEAIYYLETFRSFRGSRDDQLVQFERGLFRVVGEWAVDPTVGEEEVDERIISAAFQSNPDGGKRITVDGVLATRVSDAIGQAAGVVFTPDDVRLIGDGPRERRRFLDILLSLNDPRYLEALQRYRAAMSQRNAALRTGGARSEVAAWDELLLRAGSEVSWARVSWIREGSANFGAYYGEISGRPSHPGRIRYDSSVPSVAAMSGAEEVLEEYRRALAASREMEQRNRTTLVGPHRDEMRFFVRDSDGERDIREYGSGGERRTAALALRLLEADTIRRRRRLEPTLLLDDVFAELDAGRSHRLVELLDRVATGQVILTVPKETEIRWQADRRHRWSISEGEVSM